MCSALSSQKVLHKRVLLYFLAIMHTYYVQSAWHTGCLMGGVMAVLGSSVLLSFLFLVSQCYPLRKAVL